MSRKSIGGGGGLPTDSPASSIAEQKKRAAEWAERMEKAKIQKLMNPKEIAQASNNTTEDDRRAANRRQTIASTLPTPEEEAPTPRKSRRVSLGVAGNASVASETETESKPKRTRNASSQPPAEEDDASVNSMLTVSTLDSKNERTTRRKSLRLTGQKSSALEQIPEDQSVTDVSIGAPAEEEKKKEQAVKPSKIPGIPKKVEQVATRVPVVSAPVEVVASAPVPVITVSPVRVAPLPTAPKIIDDEPTKNTESDNSVVVSDTGADNGSLVQQSLEGAFRLVAVVGVSAGLYYDYNTWLLICFLSLTVALLRRAFRSSGESDD